MAAGKFDIKDLERRMRGTLDSLKRENFKRIHEF